MRHSKLSKMSGKRARVYEYMESARERRGDKVEMESERGREDDKRMEEGEELF